MLTKQNKGRTKDGKIIWAKMVLVRQLNRLMPNWMGIECVTKRVTH